MLSVHFSIETLQDRREQHNIFKVIKRKNLQPRILYPARLSFRFDGEVKSKVQRIQHHQASFTTNTKETSLGRKHKRREKSTGNKLSQIKEMVIGSYISMITLNVNGLNAPTKRHRLAGWMKICMPVVNMQTCMHFHLPHHSA